MSIPLRALLPLEPVSEYKLHFATWNQHERPLDVFARSRKEWQGWNEYRVPGSKDVFNRRFILGLIQYYPRRERWLFGGIFEVLARPASSNYKLRLTSQGEHFIGRLLIGHPGPGVQGRAFLSETYFDSLTVAQLLDEPYQGAEFPGFEAICHDFAQLESIVTQGKPDWKAPLEAIKGVYVVTDKKNGKKYVGSAYSTGGIWQRLCVYIGTGHGWNDELTKLIDSEGLKYARENFQFALLEHRSARTDDNILIQREQHWKNVLKTREFGYNKN